MGLTKEEKWWRAFRKRLRAMRTEAGLTQAKLADKIGIDRANLVHFEKGRVRTISLYRAVKLAEALGVKLEELIG